MTEWKIFGAKTGGNEPGYHRFNKDRFRMKFYSVPEHEILELKLVEDPDGTYLGVLEADADTLSMILPAHLFGIQFPTDAEETVHERGGTIHRVRIEEL